MIGKTLSHYRIVNKLGEEGMGVAYSTEDTMLHLFVALKILPAEKVADPDCNRHFVLDAQAASSLNHPHIVTIAEFHPSFGA